MSNKIDITEAIVNELQKFNEADTSKYATSSNISALAKFLKNSVKGLIESQEGCYEKRLDSNLSVFVGWSDGYSSEPDNTIIQSKNDPTFAINAGIKSNHDYMKTDYDWLNYPYNPETGDVWDTGVTISPNENYEETAKWLLEQYAEILEALNNNEIIVEARSHKEDNEKAAPRTKLNKNGKEVRTRNMVDVSNPAVGNNSYKNQKGNQYWGTTNSEYASKRNKTGKKNEYGNDVYLADYDDMQNPIKDFQNIKRDIKSQEDTRDFYDKKRRRARSQGNYEYYTQQKEYMDSEIDKSNQKATDIVNKERDRIQNKERRSLGEYKEIEKQDKPLTENSMDKNLRLTLKDEISAEFYNELNEQLTTTLTAKIMDKYNVKSGDIAPEQAVKADELIKELSDLYADVVMQNM